MIKCCLATLFLLLTFTLPSAAVIRIGVAAPLTGVYASLGSQITTGVTFAVTEINKSGGINGEQIIVEVIDDKCNVKNATAVANQLIGKRVTAVIGHVCDRPSIEASGSYAQNNVVQISPVSQNPAFTKNRPLDTGGTYRLAARNTQQANILLDFIASTAANSKVAILDDGSVYGKGLADALREGLKGSTVEIILSETFESGEERYRTLAARIADSGVSHVFLGTTHLDAATIIRDLDRLTKSVSIIGGDSLVHPDFSRLVLEENAERARLNNIFVTFPQDPRTFPSARNAVVRFKNAGINPVGLTLRGYSAMKIIESALRRAKSTSFSRLNKAINQGDFKTPLGIISFDGHGDADIIDYVIHNWQHNTIIPVN